MHEQALMRDLMTRILGIADSEGATAVTKVSVRLGALSHFTPEHFQEHFHDSSQGTIAEGALVEAVRRREHDRCERAGRGTGERRARGAGLMCLGSIDVLEQAWQDGDARTGRLGCGKIVPLAFVPEARGG